MKSSVRMRTVGRVQSRGMTDPTPIKLRFEYHHRNPFAVKLFIVIASPGGTTETEWAFARELLVDGRLGIEGPGGDVTVAPAANPGEVLIDLLSPSGHAVLWVPDADVIQFLAATYDLVPAGAEPEHIRWRWELVGLLRGGLR